MYVICHQETFHICISFYSRQSKILKPNFYEPCVLSSRAEGNYCAATGCQALGWHLLATSFIYFSQWLWKVLFYSFCNWRNGESKSYIICLKLRRQFRVQTWIWLVLKSLKSNKSSAVVVFLCSQMKNGSWELIRTTSLTTILSSAVQSTLICLDQFTPSGALTQEPSDPMPLPCAFLWPKGWISIL